MLRAPETLIGRYGLAVVSVAVALGLSILMRPVVGVTPTVLFLGAVAVSAWFARLGPALLATLLSTIAVDVFLLQPAFTLANTPGDIFWMAIFAGVAVLISALNEQRLRAVSQSDRQAELTRVTLASIGDAVITTGADGRISFINAVAARLTGWNTDQSVGEELSNVFRIVREDNRQPVENPVDLVLRHGQIVGLGNHTLLIARDGREIPVDDSAAPIRDTEGSVVGVVLVFRDVTERRRTELEREQLLAAERIARADAEIAGKRLRYIAEASEILGSSLDYEVTLTSAAQLLVPHLADWCAIDMLDEHGAIKRLAVAHIDPEKVKWATEIQQKFPPDPTATTGVVNVLRTGRSEFYPLITDEMLVASVKNKEQLRLVRELGFTSAMSVPISVKGRTIGVITLVTTDSKRRFDPADLALAEDLARRASTAIDNAWLYQELSKTEEVLRGSRDRLDAILRGVDDGITVQDKSGRLIFANDAAARSTGYNSGEELVAAQVRDVLSKFEMLDADGAPFQVENLPGRAALNGLTIPGVTIRFKIIATGEERWSVVHATPLFDPQGRPELAVNIFHDITDLKLAELALTVKARQQAAVAEFGQKALAGTPLDELMDESVRLVAEILEVEYTKILEIVPETRDLVVRAGAGWESGIVGIAKVEAGSDSQANYTLARDEPVIVEELSKETRFKGAAILHDHAIVSGMTVSIRSPGHSYGIFGAHSIRRRKFTYDDAHFLEAVANSLAAAIERRHSETLLHEQREWLQVTLSSIGDAVIATDTRANITFINPVASSLTGWHLDEAIGKPLEDVFRIVNETTRETAGNPAIDALTGGALTGLANHTMLVARDGSEHPIDNSAAPIRDAAGKVLGVVLVFHDIAERRRNEEAIRESEKRFRMMADSAPVLIWTSGTDTLRDYFNKPWLDFTGRTLEQELGDGWLQGIHPEDRQRCADAYVDAFESRAEYRTEFRLGHRRDDYCWVLDTGIPRFGPEGRFAGYIGSCIDIDDRKHAETQLQAAKEEAEAANVAKDQFLAVLSHELRTPLMPVLTMVQFLESESEPPADLASVFSMIRRNIELEARLIDDLLDLTRITKGKLHLDLETVDLHALMRNVIEITREAVATRKLHVTVDLAASHPVVRADSARLQQVLWNLFQNAVKFTPDGGSIEVRSYNSDGKLVVEVSDTGVGIESELLPKIFEAFQQSEQTITRRFGGLGLGLTISRSIVEMHGGTLTARSAGLDKGSTFIVELLTAVMPANESRDDAATRPASVDGASIRILLVDDHADTNRVMKLLLERRGYQVTTAHDMASALDRSEHGNFDLLISDIGLPDGSGLELMRTIRRKLPLQGIALSGFGMEEDVLKSLEAGFSEHLVKPINVQVLHESIERVLSKF